jgi:CHAD domain-containing protein
MPALRKFARHAIRKRTRTMLREAARAVDSGDGTELHDVRKDVKRLRYNLEFFASVLGPETSDVLAMLSKIQDRLGTIADSDAFSRTYGELLAGLDPADPRRPGIEAAREAACGRRDKALASLRKLWAGDDGRSYPDKLAASISSALGSLSPKSEA